MLYIGTFLVGFVPALVLFDSGAIRSFVSLSFSHHINVRHEAWSRLLRVSIADAHAVFLPPMYSGYVYWIFSVLSSR